MNKHPLPLRDTAFEPLHKTQFLSKLDQRNAIHFIWIWEEDEWKTVFNTILSHFEFQIMPNQSMFQVLVNDMQRNILNRFLFAYIHDIFMSSKT